MEYISVILPLKLEWEPCYWTDASLKVGDRVSVVFAGRGYVSVVHKVGVVPECNPSAVREVADVNTGLSPVSPEELKLWEFISDYYLCTIGEVYKLAFPTIKLTAELKAVDNRRRSEERAESTRKKMADTLLNRISRLELRLEKKKEELERRVILEESGDARVRKGVALTLRAETVALAEELAAARAALDALSVEEQGVDCEKERVRAVMKENPGKPRLIVGTRRLEEYSRRVKEMLKAGLDTLILVPEVASGEVLEESLSEKFPDDVLLFTSRTSTARRRKTAEALRVSERAYVIVGTRAALFLPFRNLGLVIVDNEQDPSFKQSDHAPRFNARDVAIVLSRIHNARVLLGTACPSLESLYNCAVGKFVHDPDDRRNFTARRLIVDIPAEKRKNGMAGPLSRKLLNAMRVAGGPVALVCGWEKREDVQKELNASCPDIETVFFSYYEAVRAILSGYAVVALLQADFLTRTEDFRCDERAYQTISLIGEMCTGLFVIQTAKPLHQVFTMAGLSTLLPERALFGLPPYARVVDVTIQDDNVPRCSLMASRLRGLLPQGKEIASENGVTFRYHLPLGTSLSDRKAEVRAAVLRLEKESHYTGHISIDVDPSI